MPISRKGLIQKRLSWEAFLRLVVKFWWWLIRGTVYVYSLLLVHVQLRADIFPERISYCKQYFSQKIPLAGLVQRSRRTTVVVLCCFELCDQAVACDRVVQANSLSHTLQSFIYIWGSLVLGNCLVWNERTHVFSRECWKLSVSSLRKICPYLVASKTSTGWEIC